MAYIPTDWQDGDLITADRMNHIEQGIQNEQVGPAGRDGADGKDGKDGDPGPAGKDGQTPYIGENGNWWIGTDDTGVSALGKEGPPGADGSPGVTMEEINDLIYTAITGAIKEGY